MHLDPGAHRGCPKRFSSHFLFLGHVPPWAWAHSDFGLHLLLALSNSAPLPIFRITQSSPSPWTCRLQGVGFSTSRSRLVLKVPGGQKCASLTPTLHAYHSVQSALPAPTLINADVSTEDEPASLASKVGKSHQDDSLGTSRIFDLGNRSYSTE